MHLQVASQRAAAAARRAGGTFLPQRVRQFTFRGGKRRRKAQCVDWHGYCFDSARSAF
jgi:hypothetical protein